MEFQENALARKMRLPEKLPWRKNVKARKNCLGEKKIVLAKNCLGGKRPSETLEFSVSAI